MIIRKKIRFCLLLMASMNVSAVAYSAEQGKTQLQVQTSMSKRTGETAFSYLVSWRKGDADIRDINGLTFINGTDTQSPSSAEDIANNISKAINAAVVVRTPLDRGAVAKVKKSKFLVENKEGFDLTRVTVRDYSNQALKFSIPNKNFKSASTGIAIDFVYSAAVEYIAGFSTAVKQETAGGFISVTLDSKTPIKIKTDGKTITEIEKELADALGSIAQFSSAPIYPNFVQIRSKNYKAFDGGEVQIPSLSANSITIDVGDSGLGVLTKFVFNDVKQPVQIMSKAPYVIGLLLAGIVGFVFWKNKKGAVTS